MSLVWANLNISWESMTSTAHRRLPALREKNRFMSSQTFMKQCQERYMVSCLRAGNTRLHLSRNVAAIE